MTTPLTVPCDERLALLARAAARDALKPTVEKLQESAVELLGAMCDVERKE